MDQELLSPSNRGRWVPGLVVGLALVAPLCSQANESLVGNDLVQPASAMEDPGNDPSRFDPREFAWRKGDYKIVPYGIGWLNMAYETSRTENGAFSFFVISPAIQGEDSFIVNARATRLGFEVTGPLILGNDSAGRVEIDFHGSVQLENRAGVLLRQAYGELRGEYHRFVAGQTNDVISPLNPNMVNYTIGWMAGNVGYRRAQVRIERYFPFADGSQMTLQGSLDRSVVVDFVGEDANLGEDAGWPTLMGRWAYGHAPTSAPGFLAEIGVSGHIGAEEVDFRAGIPEDDRTFLSWSLNADGRLAIAESWGVQGEFFVGQVLGTYFGGIGQGIDPEKRLGIRSIGGWIEVWRYLSPQVHVHLGSGLDDPRNSDLSFSPLGRRSRNQMIFANIQWDVTPFFNTGFELSGWRTDYIELPRGDSLRTEFIVRYRF